MESNNNYGHPSYMNGESTLERIDSELLRYHRHVIAEVERANNVQQVWFDFLVKRYNITGNDVIQMDGVIVRESARKNEQSLTDIPLSTADLSSLRADNQH